MGALFVNQYSSGRSGGRRRSFMTLNWWKLYLSTYTLVVGVEDDVKFQRDETGAGDEFGLGCWKM